MAGTRPPDRITPRILRVLQHTAFIAMLACAICILFLGLTSKSDNPAFRNVGGASLPTIQNMYVHKAQLRVPEAFSHQFFADAVQLPWSLVLLCHLVRGHRNILR